MRQDQWLKAQQTNNVELLAPLLADNVVETSDAGKNSVVTDAKSDTQSR